ncbi:MAG: hypothetical protein ACI814_003301 [Mariniblastus sp.]|jgi:hypothetical protein
MMRQRLKESSVVKRLLVVMLFAACGLFAQAPCEGQDVDPAKKSPPIKTPILKPADATPVKKPTQESDPKSPKKVPDKYAAKPPEADNAAKLPKVDGKMADDKKQDGKKADDKKQDDKKADDKKADDKKPDDKKPDDKKPDDKKPDDKKPGDKMSDDKKVDDKKVDEKVAEARVGSEQFLPASTKFWISIPDADELEKHFEMTQFAKLGQDSAVKPFIDSLRGQIKEVLNDQNVRLGLEVDDLQGVHSGEICIAGVLPEINGQQSIKGSHGLVLLVDVTGKTAEALELQDRINKELVSRGAKQETKTINGVEIIKSIVNIAKPIRHSQTNFQAIHNERMLICDNEAIFRDVLRRLAAPKKIQAVETLGAQKSFLSIMENTDLKEDTSHIRWFIDPFGYIQLAQALEDEKRGNLQGPRDDWAKILRDQGFSAFRGVGGNVSVATKEHELLHRTFTYAPLDPKIKNGKRIFDLFAFNGNKKTLEPASWVPADCSAYVVGNWDFSKTLLGVGGIYDAFLEEEGAFKRILNDFKVDPDMQLDIHRLVGLIDSRMTVVSAVERPITGSSERIVIGFPIKGEADYVFGCLKRATQGKVINLGGIKVIEVDSVVEEEDLGGGIWDLPGEEPIEVEEAPKRNFELFEKRYFVVHNGQLLVSNNKNYLRKLLAQKESGLAQSADYIQVKDAIGKLTDTSKVSWRQFGRADRTLEANYEMIRRGEMANSQTVLARMINQVFAKHAEEMAAAEGKTLDEDAVRKQKLDGSKLPKDYAQKIAPFLGPMGMVMENEKDGWRITGCVLKKKGITEVVQKTDDEPSDSQQR